MSGKIDVIEDLLPKVDTLARRRRDGLHVLQGAGQARSAARWSRTTGRAGARRCSRRPAPSCMLPVDTWSPHVRLRRAQGRAAEDGRVGPDRPRTSASTSAEATRAKFAAIVKAAKTVVWNGPMGVFEIPRRREGHARGRAGPGRCHAHGAITVVGGGDSVAAIEKNGLENAGEPRLDRRRRLARVPRRQGAAGRRVPQRQVMPAGCSEGRSADPEWLRQRSTRVPSDAAIGDAPAHRLRRSWTAAAVERTYASQADRRKLEDVQDRRRGRGPRRGDQEGRRRRARGHARGAALHGASVGGRGGEGVARRRRRPEHALREGGSVHGRGLCGDAAGRGRART